MNLVLLFPEDFISPTQVRLTGEKAKHVREVLRVEIGNYIKVGCAQGDLGQGRVLALSESDVILDVSLSSEGQPISPSLSLILALPRPQTLKKVLETVSCFGMDRLMLIATGRVEKSYFQSRLLKNNEWMKFVHRGVEQGGHTKIPSMSLHHSFREFLLNMDSWLPPQAQKVLLDPGARETLWDVGLSKTMPLVFAMGPEGGWLDQEIKEFTGCGFHSIQLGRAILRVENAVCAFLAQRELLAFK